MTRKSCAWVPTPISSAHLVESDNHLPHAQSVGEESVLSRLSVRRDAGLEFTRGRRNHKDCNVRLERKSGDFQWNNPCRTQDLTVTCDVPVIIFLMKSLWPGASMIVK
jgi:hypothetical protein